MRTSQRRRNGGLLSCGGRNKTDLVSSSEGCAVSKEAALDFINELVPPSGSPSSSLATREGGGDLTPRARHVFGLVPGGPDDEVVVHNDDSLDSDALNPVDIILVDETRSAVVHHTSPTGTTMLARAGKTQRLPSQSPHARP